MWGHAPEEEGETQSVRESMPRLWPASKRKSNTKKERGNRGFLSNGPATWRELSGCMEKPLHGGGVSGKGKFTVTLRG